MRTRAVLSSTFLVFVLACGGGGGGSDAATDSSADAAGDAGDSSPATCTRAADCDDGLFCNGVETCDATNTSADERGCVVAASVPCLESQTCNEADDLCVSDCAVAMDADGDGHDAITCGGDDCDDADPMRFPGNAEVCDASAHDEDCDPSTFGSRDADGDTYIDAACCNVDASGGMVCGDDCDDAEMSVHPTAAEACNNIDDNCDGVLSETEDADRDGFAKLSCSGTDCNDGDDRVYLGAPELCDRIDNDCSLPGPMAGRRDVAEDVDGDGFAPIDATCTGGPLPKTDCDDSNSAASPVEPEICDGVDNNCDGTLDEEPEASAYCDAMAPTSVACVSGACVLMCSATRADCDGNIANGCEKNTATDANNCGSCGTTCTLDCVASSCDEPVEIAVGFRHACLRRASGRVYCWGFNRSGQLGDGTTTSRNRPVLVSGLMDAVEITAGGYHTCARRASGQVVCWGSNLSGQLGDGTMIDRLLPTSVSALSDAAGIAAGFAHSCAYRASGQAVCWGRNSNGQLGDGTTIDRSTPAVVLGLGDAAGISAGQTHSCAHRADKTLLCWGNNASGQLGDATNTSRSTPGVVRPGTRVGEVVSAGMSHTCALSVGRVWCWGNNTRGELGDGTTTSSNVGIQPLIPLLSRISAGVNFTCGVPDSRQLLCWGRNDDGQLGDGSIVQSSSPVEVLGVPDALEVGTGFGYACALRRTGQVVCWGQNGEGELGDGTIDSHRLAAPIARP
ncbi:MAG: hypothetical protein GXP55_21710 [Deltaproteobacteria bacterium]|nr:hypothetical protein [Deltaproteobacteria bacterium]